MKRTIATGASQVRGRRRFGAAAVGIGAALLAGGSRAEETLWPSITAFPTGQRTAGRWVWADHFTDDLDSARRFYAALFGWRFESTRSLEDRYFVAYADDERVGGFVVRNSVPPGERGNRWVPFVSVEDPSQAAQRAVSAGGRVLLPPRALPGRGNIALLADPEGTAFGAIRAADGEPDDYLAELNEWVWLELWSRDAGRAAEFLQRIAGYSIERGPDEKGGPHLQLAAGGHGRASVRSSPFPHLAAAWIPFVRVADAAAAAARVGSAGGHVAVAPRPSLADGKVAVFVDPGGAPVGVLAV